MYRNFICYRGGSSAGILFAEDIFRRAKVVEKVIGKTYYSLFKEDKNEIRNFLTDPQAYLCEVDNFVMLLTKDFLEGFLIDGAPNPNSVTRIEIDEALKNKKLKFIPVVFPDFSWDGFTGGKANKDIVASLWGEEAMLRIVGSPPIQFVFAYKDKVIETILLEMDTTGTLKNLKDIDVLGSDHTFRLESTPSVIPKSVFCGREEELAKIKEVFDSGERVLFLQGIGGIGKTQIAKQYAKRNKSQYDTIVYATYTTTIMELVASQACFKIDPGFARRVNDDGTQESDASFFARKLELIREITNERTLIIIDNFDVMDDEHFADLIDAKYKLLITTRCNYSRLYPTIKIEPLDSPQQLRRVFLENYEGYMVDEDDEHLDELIALVNRHTYTIELIAQHMENSGQTTEEMIAVLKREGIVSLNEEVRSSADSSAIAYQNLLKMFKVFNLTEDEKRLLQHLSLFPISGVDPKDIRNWLGPQSLKLLKNLENRSWIVSGSNGVALHPIIRDVVRFELPLSEEEAEPFLNAFIVTVGEEKSWHYPINVKTYYGDIAVEVLSVFNKITDKTAELYRNCELLLSFSVRPALAVSLCADLFKYYASVHGEDCPDCANISFQAGWTYLFNRELKDSLKHSREWFDISYKIYGRIKLEKPYEFASYGHLLSHVCRIHLLTYVETHDPKMLEDAYDYGRQAVANAEAHLNVGTPYYSRLAVAYMQLSEVEICAKRYEEALSLLDDAYKIIVSLFGAEDPDTLNIESRRSGVLFCLGRYEEALALGRKNVDLYARYNGEVNYLRLEQMMIVLRCLIQLGDKEGAEAIKASAVDVARQLLSEDSPMLKGLLAL